jgi:hypothetical protein
VHLTIPTDDPWVPLRILGLGKQADDFIEADVFLLTDEQPNLLPAPNENMVLAHSDDASDLLLDDLRADAGMEWIPDSAHLTKLSINSPASELAFDLAIDPTGTGAPSRVDAGLELPVTLTGLVEALETDDSGAPYIWIAAAAIAYAAVVSIAVRFPRARE